MTRTILHAFAAALLLGCITAGAIAPMDFDSTEQRERFQELTGELRCLVCQNQSLADSDADLAQDMRQEVLKLMKAGHSDDEIRAFLVERYGDFVLYDPPMAPSTWLLWFGPGLLVIIGITTLLVALRRRRRAAATDEDGSNQ